jgi:D-3-phosphoglycerate dehydrogenase
VRAVLDIREGRIPRGVVNRDVLENQVWKKRLADFARRFASA